MNGCRPDPSRRHPQKQLRISHSFQIFVGRTASENEELLRHHVWGNDYWFHCRDCPGVYVFVKSVPGKTLLLGTMLDAGNLALFYSKGKSSGQGDVYYTQVQYLRRVKGGKSGPVIPTREKALFVRLDRETIGIPKALS